MNFKIKKINVCISCVGGILIYDFIQSLKNQKDLRINIIGIDKDKNAHGKTLCDKFYSFSEIKNKKSYLIKLVKILRNNKVDIFFPLSDNECQIVTNNINLLKKKLPNTNFWVGESHPNGILTDKKKFLEFCKSNNFYIEKYFIIKNFKELEVNASKIKAKKLILKKLTGSGSKGVYLINKNIKKTINILKGRECYETNINFHKKTLNKKEKFVLMPYFDGDFFDVDCIARDGQLLDIAIRKRNNQNQFLFYSTGHKTVQNKLIKQTIKYFIKKSKINGPCDFDVILRNKKVILMEASARLSGSVGICTKAGINFPSQAIRLAMKLKYKTMNLKKDIVFRTFLTSDIIPKSNSHILMNYYIPYFEEQLKY
jgi:hypothetical protein